LSLLNYHTKVARLVDQGCIPAPFSIHVVQVFGGENWMYWYYSVP